LSDEERQELKAIACAAEAGEPFMPDPRIVANLLRKGVIRTKGKDILVTQAGVEELKKGAT